MSDHLNEYTGALKHAFSRVSGIPQDWTQGVWSKNEQGQMSADFENAQAGIKLRVTDAGDDAEGNRKFNATGDGIDINMSIPAIWKNLKV